MKKVEFERKLKELKLEKVYYEGKSYTEPKNFYEDKRKNNVYSCYYDGTNYVIFFKDAERGIVRELGYYKTEDEAYNKLFEIINEWAKKNNK